jgi:thiol-disulfide isomerase/thioredoxin
VQLTPWRLLVPAAAIALAACSRSPGDPPPPAAAPVAVIDPPAEPGALAPHLHAADATVAAVWLEPTADGHRLQLSRRRDGAWSRPTTVTATPRLVANWADTPAVAIARDGALFVTWAERAGAGPYAYHAMVARSGDGGATWAALGPLHLDRSATEHGFVSMTADGDGVRAFWLDGRATADGGPTTLRTAHVAAAVGPDALVDDRVCDCCGTAAATGPDGPVVAYRDRGGDELRDIALARHDSDGWRGRAVHDDGWRIAGCPVNGPAIAARGPRFAVAWYTYADGTHRVRAALSTDGGASFGAPIAIDEPRGRRAPLGRVAIAMTADGDAIVGWMASTRDDARILVRRVAPDGAAGAEVEVGATVAGRDAGFPRLAVTGDQLVVAWTEPAGPLRMRALPVAAVPRAGRAAASASEPSRPSAVGGPAPPLTARTLDGSPASLAALRGRPVLVNVWATWCEPCRQELPELAALHARFAGRADIVAVNVDRERNGDAVRGFVAKRALPFAVWLDPGDATSAALGVAALPATVLVDRAGVIRWRSDGAVRADDPALLGALERAIAAPPP